MSSPPVRDVHVVLGFPDYRFPVDVLLLHDAAADVKALRPSLQALCEQIQQDNPGLDVRHAVGHWKDFGEPPLAFRPGGNRLVLAAMGGTPLFGRSRKRRPDDLQRLINALVRDRATVVGVPGKTVRLTPAIATALRYFGAERLVAVTPGTTVRFLLFAEAGVRTAEAEWDLEYDGVTFRGGPTGDRVEHTFTRPGWFEVAVRAGGYREYLADRSPPGEDNTVILGIVKIEVEEVDPDEPLVLEESVADPDDSA